MRVICLGTGSKRLEEFLTQSGETSLSFEEPFQEILPHLKKEDFAISYGYRYILKASEIRFFLRPPINLHIALLPWNRGADPNLWSFLEDTPKGVTIHEITEGLDKGGILLQKEIQFGPRETLSSSYIRLTEEVETLLKDNWKALKENRFKPTPPLRGGSYHRAADKERYRDLLRLGWDTPVSEITGRAL
jgi:methionyl-tRNA formyltransferase